MKDDEADAANEDVIPVGVCELETVNKFECKDGMITFEAFQINKERNKEWYLKADSEEELQAWAKKIEEFSGSKKEAGSDKRNRIDDIYKQQKKVPAFSDGLNVLRPLEREYTNF